MENLFASLVYFGLFQGLFILSVLLFGKQLKNKLNGYLVLLISVVVVGLSGRALLLLELFGYEPRLITISEFAMFMFGPAYMLFVRSSLEHRKFKMQDLVHFIPSVIHIVYLFIYFILASDEVINGRFESGELIRIVLILGALGLIINISYWIWSCVLLIRFKKKVTEELSFVVKFHFMKLFLIAIGVCLVFWFSILLITYLEYELFARVVYNFVWLGLTLIILFIGFYSFTKPELFNIEFVDTKDKYAKSKLSCSDIDRLKSELDDLMLAKKPYLNKRLLKAELAEMLGINSPDLARLLNEGFGMNFFEFTNYYRIKEFINLVEMKQFPNFTFLAIAEEAGFNSKATFNKAFKEVMGKTPRQYF